MIKLDWTKEMWEEAISYLALKRNEKVDGKVSDALYDEFRPEWWVDIQIAFRTLSRSPDKLSAHNISKYLGSNRRNEPANKEKEERAEVGGEIPEEAMEAIRALKEKFGIKQEVKFVPPTNELEEPF